MAKSHVETDRKEEALVGAFLDLYFYPKFGKECRQSFCRIDHGKDPKLQEKGVDVIARDESGSEIYIDEKAQLNYKNNPLKTFALELLSSRTTGEGEKIGWFIDDDLGTQFYALIWMNKCKVGDAEVLTQVSDIEEIEIMFVPKEKLTRKCEEQGLSKERLLRDSRNHREAGVNGAVPIDGVGGDFKYYYSKKLKEKPVNLVVKKAVYKSLSKSHYRVTPKEIVKL